jgi:hypothetical protein
MAPPRDTRPAVSDSGISLSVSASRKAMTRNGMRYQNTGASESA